MQIRHEKERQGGFYVINRKKMSTQTSCSGSDPVDNLKNVFFIFNLFVGVSQTRI